MLTAPVTAYLSIAGISFRQRFVYRADSLLGIVSTALGYFIMVNVWTALYAGRAELGGVALRGMITYTLVSSVLRGLSSSWIAHRIAGMANDGSIGQELIRPVSLRLKTLCEDLGGNLFYTLSVNVPAAVLLGAIYGFQPPPDAARFALFLAAAAAGVLLMQTIHFILGLIAFWFRSGEYVNFFRGALMTLFAGGFVPLWLYPRPLAAVASVLPFRFVTYEPLSIYLGRLTLRESIVVLAMQAAWIVALSILERFMWRGVQKHITAYGG